MTLATRKSAGLEDPGAELLDRVTQAWNRYGRVAVTALGVLVVVVVGGFLVARARANAEEQAAGKLAEANVMFWQGYYPRALEAARQIGQQYGSTTSGADSHRLAGDAAYWLGDFKTAVTEYRQYLDRAKPGVLADAARRSLAYALESAGQSQEAATTYESLVGRFDRESSAEFLYGAARCWGALHRAPDARKDLQRIVDEFGETTTANRARIALAEVSSGAR